MNETMTIEQARNAYRTLARASGLDMETFKYRCISILRETCDERERPRTPGAWLNAAREVAYNEMTRHPAGEVRYYQAEARAFGVTRKAA